MNNPDNKNKIAIVVVGYNRLTSIKRLLQSLLDAEYPNMDIPLVISIDCSGDEQLYEFVSSFEWPYGEKYVRIQEKRLGLKTHIIECGNLTKFFKAIVLLEDDIFVSPYFYDYVRLAVDKYGNDDRIAEISLYKNERNGYVGLPFSEIQDGNDVFLIQTVSSWGECWTEQMWSGFVSWYENECSEERIQSMDMPVWIKGWTRAWSRYFYTYILTFNKYTVFPHISLSTNFGDAGEHADANSANEQVSLLMGKTNYEMPPFEELTKYDIYYNNISIYAWLGISPDDLKLDLYGFHDYPLQSKYVLSSKKLALPIVKSFGLQMRPFELNIKYEIKGNGLFLYESVHKEKSVGYYSSDIAPYFLRGFNAAMLNKISKGYKWKLFATKYKRILKRIKNVSIVQGFKLLDKTQ